MFTQDFLKETKINIIWKCFYFWKWSKSSSANTSVIQHHPRSPLASSDLTFQPTVKSREQVINKMAMNQTATGSLKKIRMILNQHKYPVFNNTKQLVRIIGLWIWITSLGPHCWDTLSMGKREGDSRWTNLLTKHIELTMIYT